MRITNTTCKALIQSVIGFWSTVSRMHINSALLKKVTSVLFLKERNKNKAQSPESLSIFKPKPWED